MALGGYFSAPDFSAFGGSAALDQTLQARRP
jgi:hypothetical protein